MPPAPSLRRWHSQQWSGPWGGTEVTPRISDPADTTLTTQPETTTTTEPPAGPGYPISPGLATEVAETLPPPTHRGAEWLTNETLTAGVVATLSDALGADETILNVIAVLQTEQATYATLNYETGETGYLVVDQDGTARLRVGAGSWVDRHMLRQGPNAWTGSTQVTWLGLPAEAVTVTLSRPQPPTITEQPVVGGAAFFEMLKPDWNQYAQLSAYDENNLLLVETGILLDGRSCSAGGNRPPAIIYSTAPDAVEQNRAVLQDAAGRCRVSVLEELATGTGPYFGLPTDDLSVELREADRYYPLLLDIYDTVKLRHRTVESEQGTVYVWDTDTMEIGFLEDGTWQYGIIKGDHPPLSRTD